MQTIHRSGQWKHLVSLYRILILFLILSMLLPTSGVQAKVPITVNSTGAAMKSEPNNVGQPIMEPLTLTAIPTPGVPDDQSIGNSLSPAMVGRRSFMMQAGTPPPLSPDLMPATRATTGSDSTADRVPSYGTAQAASVTTTVTVNTTSDVSDGDTSSVDALLKLPDGAGPDKVISFPEALAAVNNTGPGFTINFDPGLKGKTIYHNSSMSLLTLRVSNTTIDGDVDDNGIPDINVGLIGASKYYLLVVTSANNLIRNLAFEMVRLEGESAHDNQIINCNIGTDVDGLQARPEEGNGLEIVIGAHHNIVENNVIAGNFITTITASGSGVLIAAGAHDNVVRGNTIGINRKGQSLPNEVGVFVLYGAWHNTIGGQRNSLECNTPCNIIGNNSEAGVALQGTQGIDYPTDTSDNFVQGNFIGVGPTGADPMPNGWSHALGRGTGVSLEFGATQNTIGGPRATEACDGFCNIISSNTGPGVSVSESETIENSVQGNFIGMDLTGKIKVPNVNGIWLGNGASHNIIGGERAPGTCVGTCNLIRGNTGAGTQITGQSTRGNTVRGNDILYNGGLGIDLGGDRATPNDPLDVDIGPNDLMNFPVDLRAVYDPTTNETTIRGKLDTVNPASAKVDIYNFKVVDPPSFSQGWKYLGAVTPTPIPASPDKFMFMLTVSGQLPLPYLTASATDSNGSTSELKASIIIVNTLADELNSDGDCSLREAITAADTNEPVDACISGDYDADTIAFSVTGTITSSPLPSITEDLTLAGPGVAKLTITSPDGSSPLREVDARVTLDLQDLTIAKLGGACGDYNSVLTRARISEHFYIQYSEIQSDLTISDYVNSLEAAWAKEVKDFGWAPPPAVSSNPPPGNRYHVRIEHLDYNGVVFKSGAHAGFVGNNPNTGWDDKDAYASCMILNDLFLQQLQLDNAAAHEFNHSILEGYGAYVDSDLKSVSGIFIEGGPTWMEDEVVDAWNANYSYLWPHFEWPMNNYPCLTILCPYYYWITFRGLTERYGTGEADGSEQIMQDFWEYLSRNNSLDVIAALNTALGKANPSTNLNDAFHAYAIAVKFNKPCVGNFVYPYCFKEGPNYVEYPTGETKVHGSIESVPYNYTSNIAEGYAIHWVNLPTGATKYKVTLQNTSTNGALHGSVVCETKSELKITAFPSVVGAEASASIDNFNPSGCSSVVAVLTNESSGTSITRFALKVEAHTNTDIYMGEIKQESYYIAPHQSMRNSFTGVNNGPVRIRNTESTSMMAAERVIYKVNGVNTSFSEMMGLPASQLDTIYWLPWYNNVDLDTQLRFGNVSITQAIVHVYVGETEMSGSPFTLAPGASTRQSFAGINNGPVKIVSNVNIVAAERVIYKVNKVNTSFSEMMALPNSQLNTTYWLPWYNNVDLDTQLRFGNVSDTQATIHIYIGTQEMPGSPFTLAPGASTRQSFAGINNGPVKIVSNVNIVAAERVIYKASNVNTSFSEMMALPNSQLNTTYWLPWYNNADLDTQLRFGNVSDTQAIVHVYVGETEVPGSPFTLDPGASTRQSFAGINNGPVKIESNVSIVAAERVIYKVNGINTSFSEMMALPNNELSTIYLLPWYNNVDLDTQLRFGIP